MSLIKQVLQLKQLGESNRGISRKLPIDKETINGYIKTLTSNGWNIEDLLAKEDPELERMLHAGSPAYSDPRMTDFLARVPYFNEQLTFEAILKHNSLEASADEPTYSYDAPAPTDHTNMRGSNYFQ